MNTLTRAARVGRLCALLVAPTLLTGCSLFVMAGKMLLGDPKTPCAFRADTHVDLVHEASRVLVVCTAPESLKARHSAVDLNLIDGVTRRLKVQQIQVVNPDKVASWLDDHGGAFDHPSDLAQHFTVDYIVHIELERCTFTEDNAPNLYHGKAQGNVSAYEVKSVNGAKTARQVFNRGLHYEYPPYPIAADQMSEKVFEKRFLDRLCSRISYLFYDHRLSEEID